MHVYGYMQVYGHSCVPHNAEVDKVARAGAQMSVVHKVSRRCRSAEEQQGGNKRKVVMGRGIKRQVVVQARGHSNEDNVQLVRERRKQSGKGR